MNEQYIPIGRVARWSDDPARRDRRPRPDRRALGPRRDPAARPHHRGRARDGRRGRTRATRGRAVIGAIQFLVYAATAFVFIRWFRRAYRNLAPLGAERTRFKSWWTIAGWFIPIWNVFRPKQLLNDIWRGSDPSLPPRTDAWRDGDVPGFFLLWWLLWIASTYADQVALRLTFTGDTPDELRNSSIAYLVTDAVDAVLALLAIVVLRMTTARQEERAASLGAAYGALPADDET